MAKKVRSHLGVALELGHRERRRAGGDAKVVLRGRHGRVRRVREELGNNGCVAAPRRNEKR